MQVTLDGHDIRTLDLAWYRSHVGLVAQVWMFGTPSLAPLTLQRGSHPQTRHLALLLLRRGYITPKL